MYNNQNEDSGLAIRFFQKSVLDKIETNAKGKKVFKDVDYISIKALDDKTFVREKPVDDEVRSRFAEQWRVYKETRQNKALGLPLDLLTFLSPANIANLNQLGIETVEQLASLGDQGVKNIINGRDMVNKAKRFLDGDHYVKTLESKIEDLTKEIDALKAKKKTKKTKVKDDVAGNNSEC